MQALLTAFKNTSSEMLVKSILGCDRLILENDIIKSVKQIEVGQQVQIEMQDGKLTATVTGKEEKRK